VADDLQMSAGGEHVVVDEDAVALDARRVDIERAGVFAVRSNISCHPFPIEQSVARRFVNIHGATLNVADGALCQLLVPSGSRVRQVNVLSRPAASI
jgi:hypothetical protein